MTGGRVALTCGLVLAAWLAGAGAVAADYRTDFCGGVDAARRGRWAEVAQAMRRAIGEKSTEGALVRCTYLNQLPYVPYFYLGRALKEQGNCPAALAEWDISEKAGAIKSLKNEYQLLQQGREQCRAIVAAASPAPTRAGPPPAPDPLTTSASAREEGTVTAPQPAATSAPLTEPAGRLAATQPPAVAPEVAPTEPVAAGGSAAPAAGRSPSLPPALRQAAQAYFDGDYSGSTARLGALEVTDGTLRAHQQLLLAAARFALWQLDGGRSPRLRTDAEAAVRACRSADASVAPMPMYFSPAFISFFRSTK